LTLLGLASISFARGRFWRKADIGKITLVG
jgi:hypothetical protein